MSSEQDHNLAEMLTQINLVDDVVIGGAEQTCIMSSEQKHALADCVNDGGEQHDDNKQHDDNEQHVDHDDNEQHVDHEQYEDDEHETNNEQYDDSAAFVAASYATVVGEGAE